jgi:glycosyltransferase involved in cell wall biosynthesis
MRILIIAPFLPKPNADHAGGVVLWRMIQELSRDHEIHLVAFSQEMDLTSVIQALSDCCATVDTVHGFDISMASDFRLKPIRRTRSLLFSGLPYSVWRLRSQKMREVVSRKVRDTEFDIVQIEHVFMGQYLRDVGEHPRTVLREYDLTFVHYARRFETTKVLWRKLYHFVQWRRMRGYELKLAQRFHKVILPSRVTRAQLAEHVPERKLEVIPFGVTLHDIPNASSPKRSDGKNLLFVGAMGRPYNVEAMMYFYEEIWPLIIAEDPTVRFWIVGSQPPAYISQLAVLDDRIKVTGFVEDLIPYYLKADVFVVPLTIGGGVVTKILDAMAMAKPVVTTTIGHEGIDAQDGRDLVIADTPQAFAREVLALLQTPERRRELGLNGKNFVKSEFGWDQIAVKFDEVYHELVQA